MLLQTKIQRRCMIVLTLGCLSFQCSLILAASSRSIVSVNSADQNGDTPLMVAVTSKNMESVNALIAAGANVNAKSKDGFTPLLLAPNADSVWALITAGANVNEAGANGDTPLMVAIVGKDLEVFKALIAKGANVNTKSKDGFTPLLLAPNADYVRALIAAGVNVNKAGVNGDSPLMVAIVGKDIESFKALIAAGANPNARSKDGYTPLLLAPNAFYTEALIAAGAKAK